MVEMKRINRLPLMSAVPRNYAESVKKILGNIWHLECERLHLSRGYETGLVELTDALFDPKKKLSAVAITVERLPDASSIFPDFQALPPTLEELEEQGFLRLVRTRKGKKLTLTPEGLVLLDLLETAHYSGSHCYINADLLAQRLSELLGLYNGKLSYHLFRLEKSLLDRINMAEVGLLLFFLINGSVGEENACRNVDPETAQTVETIVRSFAGDSMGKRTELHWRGWYLTEANRKLGGVIVNQEPIYYLKPSAVSLVEDEICARVTEDAKSYSFFLNGWQRLIGAYQKGRSLLEKQSIGHYSQSRADSILNRQKNQAEKKGL